jgi:hypothetical protein
VIDKETMTDLVEIEKSLDVKIQISEKGTNIDPIDIKNQKYAYIKILSTNKSPEASKDKDSKNKHKIQGCLIVIPIIIIKDKINMRS